MDIKDHIDRIVSEHQFENISKINPNACPCYTSKKCHEMEDLNCYLCMCPNYDTEKQVGGCKINSVNGKWFYHNGLPEGKIWDCSDCTIPHHNDFVRAYLKTMFKDTDIKIDKKNKN